MHLREPQSVCAFSFSRRFNFDNMVAAGNLTAAALLAKNVCATKYTAGKG